MKENINYNMYSKDILIEYIKSYTDKEYIWCFDYVFFRKKYYLYMYEYYYERPYKVMEVSILLLYQLTKEQIYDLIKFAKMPIEKLDKMMQKENRIYDELFAELCEYGYFSLLPKHIFNIIHKNVANDILRIIDITQLYK